MTTPHIRPACAARNECASGENKVIAAKEALQFAQEIAQVKHGRLIILAGMAWCNFDPGEVDTVSGLALCRLSGRDEEKWQEWKSLHEKYGLGDMVSELIKQPVRHSITPFIGQDVGLIHTGDATDVRRGPNDFSKRQFDTGVISHFRRPKGGALKMFVTSVLPGRFAYCGCPAFTRDGTLLGLVVDTESYQSDAGRRAVIRSLLGHPRFTSKEGQE